MAIFDNPNNPRQPQVGVYRWYIECHDGSKKTLYIGQAGRGKPGTTSKGSHLGTMIRGVRELFRDPGIRKSKTSPSYYYPDTNFILGTIIEYLEKQLNIPCHWEHICNDPKKEYTCAQKLNPTLQRLTKEAVHLLPAFSVHKSVLDPAPFEKDIIDVFTGLVAGQSCFAKRPAQPPKPWTPIC